MSLPDNELDRRGAIAAWRHRDPEATGSEMARGLGISRSRVQQLLCALGLPTRTRRSPPQVGGIVSPSVLPYPAPVARARVRTGGVAVARCGTHTAGTISELLVAADLLARGYYVFAPLTRHHSQADLIALPRGGEPLLIEVRSAARKGGSLVYSRHVGDDRRDHYALVVAGEVVIYRPPLPEPSHRPGETRSA